MKYTPVLFYRPHNLVSKGIRSATGSHWNHAGALFYDADGDLMLLEAVEGGVRVWLWSEAKAYYDQFECEYKFCEERTFVKDYKKTLGAGYDYMGIVRDLFYYTSLNFLGENNVVTVYFSNKDDKSKFVCFELLLYLEGHPKPWGASGLSFDDRVN